MRTIMRHAVGYRVHCLLYHRKIITIQHPLITIFVSDAMVPSFTLEHFSLRYFPFVLLS